MCTPFFIVCSSESFWLNLSSFTRLVQYNNYVQIVNLYCTYSAHFILNFSDIAVP